MKAIKIISIVLLGLCITSCTEFIFEDTQPKYFTHLTTFPDFLAGEFIEVYDSSNIEEEPISIVFQDKHTIEILKYDKKELKHNKCTLDLKTGTYQDVNLFDFESSSGQLVMKEIKEDYYCLNFQNRKEENLWSILAFRLLENNDIELKLSIQSGDFGESGAYYEGVTDYRKAPEEMSDHAYILNPSAFEFISLINADDFFETIHLRRKNKN